LAKKAGVNEREYLEALALCHFQRPATVTIFREILTEETMKNRHRRAW
jgi:hypothetical protein